MTDSMKYKMTINGDSNDTSTSSLCPLRRLEHESPAKVLPEFAARMDSMPPDHKLLLRKFQQDTKLRDGLDEKFGNDKEAMLVDLWITHRSMFKNPDAKKNPVARVERWLQGVQDVDATGES